jgi:hypothetical protein
MDRTTQTAVILIYSMEERGMVAPSSESLFPSDRGSEITTEYQGPVEFERKLSRLEIQNAVFLLAKKK